MSIKELYKVKTDVEELFKEELPLGLDAVGNIADKMANAVGE